MDPFETLLLVSGIIAFIAFAITMFIVDRKDRKRMEMYEKERE